jgi:hypothetical protein
MFRLLSISAIAMISISIGIPATALAGSVCPSGSFPHNPDAGPGGTGCNVVITVNNDGSATVAPHDPSGYDQTSDDNLVGLVNNSASPINSLSLVGSDIFGFDADGICTFSFTGSTYCSTPGHATGAAGGDYRGPTSNFTITDVNTGTVTFSPAVAPGGLTFFSLEGSPTTAIFVGPPPGLCRGKAVIANSGRSFHNANSTVVGGVQAGMDIIQNSGSKITGTTTPFTPAGLATIPVPTPVTNLGTLLIGSGTTKTLAAGDYVASSVTLNGNSTLLATGKVRLWITSGALVIGGTAKATSGVAGDLQFYVNSSTDVHVNSGGNVVGDIYAPGSNTTLIDSTISGCVVGANVTLNSNGVVSFLP